MILGQFWRQNCCIMTSSFDTSQIYYIHYDAKTRMSCTVNTCVLRKYSYDTFILVNNTKGNLQHMIMIRQEQVSYIDRPHHDNTGCPWRQVPSSEFRGFWEGKKETKTSLLGRVKIFTPKTTSTEVQTLGMKSTIRGVFTKVWKPM